MSDPNWNIMSSDTHFPQSASGFGGMGNTRNYTFTGRSESTVIPDKVRINTAPAIINNEFLPDSAHDSAGCIYKQPLYQTKVESLPTFDLGTLTREEESSANNVARKNVTEEAFVRSQTAHEYGRERSGESTSLAHVASLVPTTHKKSRDSVLLKENKRAGKALAVSDVWARVPVYEYKEAERARTMHARDESSRVQLARDQSSRAWRDDVPLVNLPTIHTKPEAIVASSDALVMAQRMNASMNEIVPNAPHTPFVFQPDR